MKYFVLAAVLAITAPLFAAAPTVTAAQVGETMVFTITVDITQSHIDAKAAFAAGTPKAQILRDFMVSTANLALQALGQQVQISGNTDAAIDARVAAVQAEAVALKAARIAPPDVTK